MSGLDYLKLGSTLSNICNTTQLDSATKCHYALKNFWENPAAVQVFWKTLWKMEKVLVTSKFFIFHSIFYPFGQLFTISLNLELLPANFFSFGESKICCLGKS